MLADYNSLEEKVDCVMSDNKLGSYKMASYLFEKGFQRIGYVGDLSYSPSTRERFYGYQEAIQRCFQRNMPKESVEYIQKYSILAEIEEMVIHQNKEALYAEFLNIPEKPDALICSNDELAILLMKVLQEHGCRIPEDIAVAGFDDIEPAKMVTPSLTTKKAKVRYNLRNIVLKVGTHLSALFVRLRIMKDIECGIVDRRIMSGGD